MKCVVKLVRVLFIVCVCLSIKNTALAIENNNVSINKSWIVKFNLKLEKSTINNENIIVKDMKGNVEKVRVLLQEDGKSVKVDFPTGGYIPGNNYYLLLNTKIKSNHGKNLSKVVKMKFKTCNDFKDCTSIKNAPNIKEVTILDKPILCNNKIRFNILSQYKGKIQYRIYVFKYLDEIYDNSNNKRYSKVSFIELTKGYTSGIDGNKPYIFTLNKGLDIGKYKLIVYARKDNKKGTLEDLNTDYDNYFSTYFKVINNDITKRKLDKENVVYDYYNITLDEGADKQIKLTRPVYSESTGWMRASRELVRYYMDSNNFLDDYGKYQFLQLNYMEITSEDLNRLLKGKGILENKGDIFKKAGKENDVNPIYLVSHALLETGNGKSQLAKGILVKSVDGKKVSEKITYNVFGIHAFDSNPIKFGSEFAYKEKWFDIDSAIIGGANFIGNSYINNKVKKQNTLYKMRWNVDFKKWPHQYATDIGWGRKQIDRIKYMVEECDTAKPIFQIPKYK